MTDRKHMTPEMNRLKVKLSDTCLAAHTKVGSTITEEQFDWIGRGEEMRLQRISRGRSLRSEAARCGLTPKELSDMEHGRVEPL